MIGFNRKYPRSARAAVAIASLLAGLVAASTTGRAQLGSGAFGNKSDANLPVSIEANMLEILQDKKQAIFTGKVIANRGDTRLRANRLIMHYVEKILPGGKKRTEVKRINAYGNVVVTNRTKKATGQWAIIYMVRDLVVMGDSVVVTEDKTILRGSRLELEMKTGKTRLLGTKKSKGRVSGIFVPQPVKKKAK